MELDKQITPLPPPLPGQSEFTGGGRLNQLVITRTQIYIDLTLIPPPFPSFTVISKTKNAWTK
jgi:hypothetical protein